MHQHDHGLRDQPRGCQDIDCSQVDMMPNFRDNHSDNLETDAIINQRNTTTVVFLVSYCSAAHRVKLARSPVQCSNTFV